VPGLGDVTPAQIQTINAELASQQNQINALDTRVDTLDTQVTTLNTQVTTLDTRVDALELIPVVTIRTSTVAVPAGNSTQVVNFSALPGANYGVSIIPVGTSTSRANMGSYVLLAGQTTTQFSIAVEDNPNTVTSLRWTAIHTA
jgi:outer membrane murein-binding lipoprotein Lpp